MEAVRSLTSRAALALLVALSTAPAFANSTNLALDDPARVAGAPQAAEGLALRAWPIDSTVHAAVRSIPREAEVSIASVAHYLRAHSHGDLDRVKAMHDWIAVRIAFDAAAENEQRGTDEKVDDVFAQRRAVCQGYARLFAALAQASGDEAVYIAGEARVLGHREPINHAWNAVRIDGRWQLLDITWDAGAFVDGKFVAHLGSDYLLTPPEIFALTHHPFVPAWQLLKPPVSRVDFVAGPMLLPSFFAHGLRLVSPQSPILTAGELEIVIDRRAGGHVSARAQALGADPSDVRCPVVEGERVVARCALAPGRYQVTLYYSPSTSGTFVSVGALPVTISAR
jgi:Transglutaminase-like superfamily